MATTKQERIDKAREHYETRASRRPRQRRIGGFYRGDNGLPEMLTTEEIEAILIAPDTLAECIKVAESRGMIYKPTGYEKVPRA